MISSFSGTYDNTEFTWPAFKIVIVSLDLENTLAPHFLNDNMETKKRIRYSKTDIEKNKVELRVV